MCRTAPLRHALAGAIRPWFCIFWVTSRRKSNVRYDYSSAESLEELEKGGIQRLRELSNYKSLKIGLNEIDAQIGDIVGGEEQITGISMKTQITNIIVKIDTKGKLTITHKVGD